ncbi:cytidylyltransferase domain-containing protein [Marisediminicola sp. LYQ134]|uniref:cytidylyltransferase domain-containing protein n=1 Tax=Marisediminicola sp. LYQ134 TaxID=3391061 RepID=UPI003982DDAB
MTYTPSPRASVVAVIPARGGSKGVPGKNLRRVGGVPLVARAAASARSAKRIDRVIVSTDDQAIAAAAKSEGADIMARPAKLSGDTASSESALLNVLERLDHTPDIIVFLQATSPFIDPADLDRAIHRVQSGECDVVFSAIETHAFLWRLTDTGAEGVNHDHTFRARRQDREAHYQETGAFYVMRAAGFRDEKYRFFGTVGVALTDERRSIEIDTAPQLELASAIAPIVDPSHDIDVDAVVTDFDGVHTDDTVVIGADGSEFVTTNRSDGLGVARLRDAGIPVLILSRERHPVVAARGRKLGVEVLQGVDDKATALTDWAERNGIDLARLAYLGNDVNDLPALEIAGWPVAVADANPAVMTAARVVLAHAGGHGAVRELADRVLRSRSPRRASPGTGPVDTGIPISTDPRTTDPITTRTTTSEEQSWPLSLAEKP